MSFSPLLNFVLMFVTEIIGNMVCLTAIKVTSLFSFLLRMRHVREGLIYILFATRKFFTKMLLASTSIGTILAISLSSVMIITSFSIMCTTTSFATTDAMSVCQRKVSTPLLHTVSLNKIGMDIIGV